MGEKPWEVTVPQPYAIARYPASNAQFRYFVEDDGYTKQWRECWTDEGWAIKEEQGWQEPRLWGDSGFNLDNQPVVGISWYEAAAYAAWLAQGHGQAVPPADGGGVGTGGAAHGRPDLPLGQRVARRDH